jgi:hypothetical protein
MLLQTNSYVVPSEKRAAHATLLAQFRQTLARLGCDLFEVYEQAGPTWEPSTTGEGRFVQIMRFRDRQHQLTVQAAERNDPSAQRLISEFCELINFPYQQEHGLFAVGFYTEMGPESEPNPIPQSAPITATTPPDVEAYIERELDEIMATFGDPRQLLQDATRAKPAAPAASPPGKEPKKFPRLARQDSSTPRADDELDSLLREQFAPAPPGRGPHVGDPELARVLDEGLAEDELDIAMPAELLDEDEMEGLDDVRQPAPAVVAPKPEAEPARPNVRAKRR